MKGSKFFPQSQFQRPLWSQPQVAKDLISGEQVGGAGPEPQSQGWQNVDKGLRDTLGKKFWEEKIVMGGYSRAWMMSIKLSGYSAAFPAG